MGTYRVYEYGVTGVPSPMPLLLDTIRGRQKLWNSLVEIEHTNRSQVLPLLSDGGLQDRINALQTEKAELINSLKSRRKQIRRRIPADDATNLKLAAIRLEIKSLVAQVKQRRGTVMEGNKAELLSLEMGRRLSTKTAYQQSDCWWGNYNSELLSYKTARKAAMKAGVDLKFRRWTGSGKVTVLYSSDPQPVATIFGNNTRLQIKPVDSLAWHSPTRGVSRRLCRTTGRIRVGSNPDKSPLWIDFNVSMHRPLPPDGKIRSAALIRRKIGLRWGYKLVITVEVERSAVWPDAQRAGTIAIDIGWRKLAEGLRTAYWVDDSGNRGQVLLDPWTTSQFTKVDDLKSILDGIWNRFHSEFGAWLKSATDAGAVPEWFVEATAFFPQWKSHSRAYWLSEKWRQNRFAGDETGFELLDVFRERYIHLNEWRVNLADQIRRRRREQYRIFAAHIARTYSRVVLEDFDLREVAEKTPAESNDVVYAGGARVVACTSELRLAIEQTCAREGVPVEHKEAAMTTQRCYVCGAEYRWDAAVSVMHKCGQCGSMFDQDFGAASNLLKTNDDESSAAVA